MSSLPAGARAAGATALLAAALATASVQAQTPAQVKRAEAEIGVEEKLGALVPREARFEDSDGSALTLAALAGRPLLLSFNYTGCPRLCSVQLAGLARGLRDLGWAGDRFSIVTVSIDPSDTAAQLARYESTYVGQAGGAAGAAASWHFLRGAKADVDALATAVGFRYRYDPGSGEFDHQATVVVLTGDGRVSGYLHGVTYADDALRAAIGRAEAGRIATPEEQASLGGFLLSCMGLDPGDPLPLALKLMRLGGVATAAFLGGFLLLQLRRSRRAPRPPRTSP